MTRRPPADAGRPVTAIERRLGIPHATFHRHYADLIDTHFRPRIPAAGSQTGTDRLKTDEPKEENLRRLRQENTDLRRTLAPLRGGHARVERKQLPAAALRPGQRELSEQDLGDEVLP
ncbi:hypothetical protein ACU639_37650 [Streptomyces cynarae]|uniref:hypothetical protein n=1 Tax=Streptomyces cynarae TaxID=2981134 RepID=UPI00406D09BC